MTDSGCSTVGTATECVWSGGDAFELRSVQLPSLGPGEVLVRVLLAGVCGSDRHTVLGHRHAPCPSVLGHESVGVIVGIGRNGVEAGSEGSVYDVLGGELHIGDRVVWSVTVACGLCDRCRAGVTAKCRELRKVGHEPVDGAWVLSGGYASHMLLPRGAAITRVPEELGDRAAALASCAGGTAVAVVEASTRAKGRTDLSGLAVLVTGAGALGAIATAACVALGARVTVSDVCAERLSTVRALGAADTLLIDPSADAGEDAAEGAAHGRFDVVLEFSGSPDGVRSGLAALRLEGVLVLAGTVSPIGEIPLDPEHVVRRHLTITGVHNYEPRHLVRAVELLGRDPVWEQLVDAPLPLSSLPEALLEPAENPAVLRRSVSAWAAEHE